MTKAEKQRIKKRIAAMRKNIKRRERELKKRK